MEKRDKMEDGSDFPEESLQKQPPWRAATPFSPLYAPSSWFCELDNAYALWTTMIWKPLMAALFNWNGHLSHP